MDQTFGARLRQHREQQQISLDAIARDTKIKQALLDGLERDDVTHWPTGIFRRAYVRSYAQAIHLDPNAVVREFVELYPDPFEVAEAAAAAAEAALPQSGLRRAVHSALASVPLLLRTEKPISHFLNQTVAAVPARRHIPAPAPDLNDHVVSPAAELYEAHDSATGAVESYGTEEERASEAVLWERAAGDLRDIGAPADAGEPEPQEAPRTRVEISLPVVAEICSRIARIVDLDDVESLLPDAAHTLDAAGMIVWVWEPRFGSLRPALAHGYSPNALDRMPVIRRDSDSALADAFRSGETTIVPGSPDATGAVIVPMLTVNACVGVLTVEWRDQREQDPTLQAMATILAAQLAALFGGGSMAAVATA